MITSMENRQVKELLLLQRKPKERRIRNVYLIEGLRMFEEAPGAQMETVYVSESFLAEETSAKLPPGFDYVVLSDAVFRHISDTQSPQGILCVMRRPHYEAADLQRGDAAHLLLLENIQDPGNLGTMFRTAEGAGVTGIIMNRGCVDIFAPKTVRSTMGSIFRVPFLISENLAETIGRLKENGVAVYAAHLDGEQFYDAFDYRGKTAFLIGNEGNGLSKETAALADAFLRIPMAGKLESLNAAMAAGILMYEANRQRRRGR